MRMRIVIADQAEARFYDAEGFGRRFAGSGSLRNPAGRLHERELGTDRPARVFERAAIPGRRRGASARHASGGEQVQRRHSVALFARRIGAELERSSRARPFDALVLVAGPRFLGLLRRSLPATVREKVIATVPKDIVHQEAEDLLKYLPRNLFSSLARLPGARRTTARG